VQRCETCALLSYCKSSDANEPLANRAVSRGAVEDLTLKPMVLLEVKYLIFQALFDFDRPETDHRPVQRRQLRHGHNVLLRLEPRWSV
jgi:hypothetical protein